MSIKGYVSELKGINSEIKRYCEQMRKLRKRKKELESLIVEFLDNKEQVGLKHNDTAIIVETTAKRAVKKQSDRERDVREVLLSYGVDDADNALKDLLTAYRGEKLEEKKLKIKALRNKKE